MVDFEPFGAFPTKMHTNTPSDVGNAATFIAEIYGQDVFNMETMRGYLPRPVYKKLLATIRKDEKLDPDIANEVAQAMMTWRQPLHALVPAPQRQYG